MAEPPGLEAELGLRGKTAIVAGGGAAGDGIGNGRAAAILLARAGAKVFVVDRNLELAERTRDLRIALLWVRASVNLTGFAVLAFHVARTLLLGAA